MTFRAIRKLVCLEVKKKVKTEDFHMCPHPLLDEAVSSQRNGLLKREVKELLSSAVPELKRKLRRRRTRRAQLS